MRDEIQILKEKNRSINSTFNNQIKTLTHSHKYVEINNKVYKDIKNFLKEKEILLAQQVKTIKFRQKEWEIWRVK